ncbi:MAG: hypothetical protein FJZ01_02040 [Candidatus Sericytochromatia bacterium]|nr:hypothetical protein [Candidatus Tanganyikabacteria bacterium]
MRLVGGWICRSDSGGRALTTLALDVASGHYSAPADVWGTIAREWEQLDPAHRRPGSAGWARLEARVRNLQRFEAELSHGTLLLPRDPGRRPDVDPNARWLGDLQARRGLWALGVLEDHLERDPASDPAGHLLWPLVRDPGVLLEASEWKSPMRADDGRAPLAWLRQGRQRLGSATVNALFAVPAPGGFKAGKLERLRFSAFEAGPGDPPAIWAGCPIVNLEAEFREAVLTGWLAGWRHARPRGTSKAPPVLVVYLPRLLDGGSYSGNSIGLAAAAAGLAIGRGESVPADLALTGAVAGDGTVGSVWHVWDKAAASRELGVVRLAVPRDNQIEASGPFGESGVAPIDTVEDLAGLWKAPSAGVPHGPVPDLEPLAREALLRRRWTFPWMPGEPGADREMTLADREGREVVKLLATSEPGTVLVLGDGGSGKSWSVLMAGAQLADRLPVYHLEGRHLGSSESLERIAQWWVYQLAISPEPPCLLLDGLDEAPRFADRAAELAHFVVRLLSASHGRGKLLIASRPAAVRALETRAFAREQVDWVWMAFDPRQSASALGPGGDLPDYCTTPFLAQCYRFALPRNIEGPAGLLSEVVDLVWRYARDKKKDLPDADVDRCTTVLRTLAYEEVLRGEARADLVWPADFPDSLREALLELRLLDQRSGAPRFGSVVVRDHFAARHLLEGPERLPPGLESTRWRGPILQAAELLLGEVWADKHVDILIEALPHCIRAHDRPLHHRVAERFSRPCSARDPRTPRDLAGPAKAASCALIPASDLYYTGHLVECCEVLATVPFEDLEARDKAWAAHQLALCLWRVKAPALALACLDKADAIGRDARGDRNRHAREGTRATLLAETGKVDAAAVLAARKRRGHALQHRHDDAARDAIDLVRIDALRLAERLRNETSGDITAALADLEAAAAKVSGDHRELARRLETPTAAGASYLDAYLSALLPELSRRGMVGQAAWIRARVDELLGDPAGARWLPPTCRAFLLANRGLTLMASGESPLAEADFGAAYEIFRSLTPGYRLHEFGMLALLEQLAGEPGSLGSAEVLADFRSQRECVIAGATRWLRVTGLWPAAESLPRDPDLAVPPAGPELPDWVLRKVLAG